MNEPEVLIVGAGPVGMTAALGLARYGIRSRLFDEDHVLSEGSRAIAFSSDTLAAWERLGAARAMLAKGVAWSVRHTYFRDHELFTQNFPRSDPGFMPGFFNIQQYYVERYLLDQIEANPLIDVCWDHKVSGYFTEKDFGVLQIDTPTGRQEIAGRYLLACDGAHSSMRKLLGLSFPGVTHTDHFLIADVRVDLNSPPEPRFFFDHATNPGQTILIHPQPDGIWRIDWQFGPKVDMQTVREPENLKRRIEALIGSLPFEIVWLSDYRFHQRLLERFRYGPVFFLGDAAHLVAPFGAHGLNSAVADVENLVWKLAFVLRYRAPDSLLDTFQIERWPAQQHSQAVTNTTMRFMSPPNPWRRFLRNAILRVSAIHPPTRRQVNSGKMVQPFSYRDSPLLSPDDSPAEAWLNAPAVGSKLRDAACLLVTAEGERQPIFLRSLIGEGMLVLLCGSDPQKASEFFREARVGLPNLPIRMLPLLSRIPDPVLGEPALVDASGTLQQALAAQEGTFYLIRPDGHIAARRRSPSPSALAGLVCQACGFTAVV